MGMRRRCGAVGRSTSTSSIGPPGSFRPGKRKAQQMSDEGERRALVAARKFQVELENLRTRLGEPIAIVGLAARTPFESRGIGIWQGLSGGIDASGELPADRWGTDLSDDRELNAAGRAIPKRGGFIPDVHGFDARF